LSATLNNHNRCSYAHESGARCQLPGVGADASGDSWYCWLHIDNRPRGFHATADLESVNRNAGELTQAYYRDDYGPTLDERVDADLAAHPEYFRGADEPSSVYQARMMKLWQEKFPGLVRKVAGNVG
jgi:hypothetical protein